MNDSNIVHVTVSKLFYVLLLGEADTLLSTFVVWALIYAEVQSFHDAFTIVQVATVENDC